MRYVFVAAVLIGAFADCAWAQTPTIDSYKARFYDKGALAPRQTETFLATAVTCNQVAPVTPSVINPTRLVWDDTANAGKVCIYVPPTTAALFSLPLGDFEGTLAAVDSLTAEGAESARAPFSFYNGPAARTGFKVIR